MEVDTVIQAFRKLGNSDRRAALEALANEFDPYEWRFIQEKLNNKSFSRDIVGALPVELVSHIFSHLDIAAAYYYQIVCKQWRETLRCTAIVKPTLRAWFTDNDRPLALGPYLRDNNNDDDGDDDDYALCQLKAEYMHRFCTGKPHKFFTLRTMFSNPARGTLLCGDYMSWVPGKFPRTINVLNLRTGVLLQESGDAREKIHKVALSESIVAFTSHNNVCYVRDLVTRTQRIWKLTPTMLQHIACRDRMIACGGVSEGIAKIYLIDFDKPKGRTIDIPITEAPFAHRRTE
ncbi:uncharacterized protein BDR25DRAFT_241584 [Lindgomyces ingoldianus]|uniref:Uncharacterized protein n=1 Tax=Lindgomyces ingoldianus TaxID=673940 RepID=A0ACB6QEX6_9PLEO|nr:uncharacterized protein BDR25DRAFT_241584 [Lindgomyces ingoldianus]KAF2464676.1 hypothetical protein BDR25DRAFT_241584 [Lindgomyces ingoldianus]